MLPLEFALRSRFSARLPAAGIPMPLLLILSDKPPCRPRRQRNRDMQMAETACASFSTTKILRLDFHLAASFSTCGIRTRATKKRSQPDPSYSLRTTAWTVTARTARVRWARAFRTDAGILADHPELCLNRLPRGGRMACRRGAGEYPTTRSGCSRPTSDRSRQRI